MTIDEIMQQLERRGDPQTKKTFVRHGAPEPLFGVRVGDLKSLQKKLKGEQALALELYATGNSDAMYLAGLIANGALMTKTQLDQWAKQATWPMLADYAVAWVAAEHPQAVPLASKWIDSKRELVASAGWSTLAAVAATIKDDALPLATLDKLLERVEQTINSAANRVRYAMNSFVIAVGTYVEPLADRALTLAQALGEVKVDMGNTACKVPEATSYIVKARRGAAVAPKRKTARC